MAVGLTFSETASWKLLQMINGGRNILSNFNQQYKLILKTKSFCLQEIYTVKTTFPLEIFESLVCSQSLMKYVYRKKTLVQVFFLATF